MKRPHGVTVLGVLILLVGLVLTAATGFAALVLFLHFIGTLPPGWEIVDGRLQAQDMLLLAAQLALGVAGVASGVGMLLLRTWAWLMALALLGCELVIQLSNYFQGHPAYWAMTIAALLVLYLNQRSIREAFNIEPKRVVPPSGIYLEPAVSEPPAESGAPAARP